jgi:ATP-dependent protease ClpP protease subunit
MPTKIDAAKPQAVALGETEILVYSDIGESWWNENAVTANRIAAELKEAPRHHNIVVRINSFGGDAFEGVAIYNLLVNDGRKIVTKVDGAAISAASIIAMAGTERLIAENAMVMIHDPWTIAMGNAEDFRSQAESLDLIADALCKTYERRSAKSFDECRELMRAETWMGAEDAVRDGFCTGVMVADDEADSAMASISRIAASLLGRSKNAPDLNIVASGRKHTFRATNHDEVIASFKLIADAATSFEASRFSQILAAERGADSNNQTPEAPKVDLTELQAALKAAQGETAQMRTERDSANAALDAAKSEAKAKADESIKLAADVAALNAQNEKLCAERDEAVKNAAALNDQVLAAEVDALVGVKIDPCERDQYLALAKTNRDLFNKFVEQRAPKTTLSADPAGMGKEPLPESINDSGDEDAFARFAASLS